MGLTYTNYEADMKIIASYGFVVVASEVNENGNDPQWSAQQLAVIKSCKARPSLHPAFKNTDFSRCAVAGHSMGAMATAESAADGGVGHCIKAGNVFSFVYFAKESRHLRCLFFGIRVGTAYLQRWIR